MPTKPSTRPTWGTDAVFASGPQIGQPVRTDPAGNAAQGFVPGEPFHSGFVNHTLNAVCDEWLPWLDGTGTAANSNIYGLGFAVSPTVYGTTTLSADYLHRSITVNSGATLNPAGHTLRAVESITVNGAISVSAGTTATLPSGGAAGAGGTTGNAGSTSATGSSAIYLGGSSGNGGAASAGVGAAITATSTAFLGASLDAWITCSRRTFAGTSFRYGGAGGGGGSGGPTGAGGAGGAGGGIIVLVAPAITLASTAIFSASGANGSNAGGGSGAGGGGGGGGGAVILVCEELDNQGAAFILPGGNGGNGNGSGSAGSAGQNGRAFWVRPSTQVVTLL